MKKFLALPLRLAQLLKESCQDSWRYFSAASIASGRVRYRVSHLESNIVRRSHILEKGLAMPDFRPRFGEQMVRELQRMLNEWSSHQSYNAQVASAWRTLESYIEKHNKLSVDVMDFFGGELRVPDEYKEGGEAGTKGWNAVSIEDRDAFLRVMSSRSSMRNYDPDKKIDKHLIERVIESAITTPSVCNRQTWRVHAYSGEKAQRLLALQNGNRGFGHTIPMILVITSDMRHFVGAIERFQPWVDGGMFSMSLLLALHAEGLGAVPLNWSVLNSQDQALRSEGQIPDHERIIMLIGCGYPDSQSLVTVSARRGVDEILKSHDCWGVE